MDLKTFITVVILSVEAVLASGRDHHTHGVDPVAVRDYFRSCLALKESWLQANGQAKAPTHPLTNQRTNPAQTTTSKSQPCRSYKCLAHSGDLDLRKLGRMKCRTSRDCAADVSGMVCANITGSGTNYCDCPIGQAYDTNECRCQPAELCWKDSDPCHKGMKCQDRKCSCKHLDHLDKTTGKSKKLYEPHGGFCVLPRMSHFGINSITSGPVNSERSASGPEVIVVGLLAAILALGLIGLAAYVISARRSDIDLCARGDYIVDTDTNPPGNRQNQPHVAAWDAPGMDFLSEEQTLKYVNRTASSGDVNSVTKSPSVATTAELVDEISPSPSGSLPECEQGAARGGHLRSSGNVTNYDNPVFNNGKSGGGTGSKNSSAHSSKTSSSSNSSSDAENDRSTTKASNIL